ncbi:MAG: tripartite tricarboxylate transporter substrate binding protein, partial [Gemmobacter sp.]|nr:tripartite tricarboxylate transporter substrate binding protein [Gemmobacter sp.]
AVLAQTAYPSKDIAIIVPYSPGASGDLLARQYAELLSKKLGVTVVVDNAPGGSGTIGTVKIFGSAPDGYTLGYGHNSPLAIQPHKNAGLPYKNGDDFTAIGGIGHQAGTVSVNGASEWQTFAEFVAAAKAKPGEISIAVGGAGNVKDLQLQQFQKASGVEFNIVPFAGGGAEAVVSAMGNIVDAVSVNPSSVAGQIASGDLRPLAIFANSTEDMIDGFKVVGDKDYPGMQFLQDSSGIIAPKGVPADIVAILDAAHQSIMQDPAFIEVLKRDGYIIDPANAAEYRDQLMADFANFGEVLGK